MYWTIKNGKNIELKANAVDKLPWWEQNISVLILHWVLLHVCPEHDFEKHNKFYILSFWSCSLNVEGKEKKCERCKHIKHLLGKKTYRQFSYKRQHIVCVRYREGETYIERGKQYDLEIETGYLIFTRLMYWTIKRW